ncbi:hypothetical protein LTR37_006055 [Vermiconidia calcicola]|uniref:Uncharacterized protein n=1 Tax=Vermiconidia calcicola TaxID=1690605 RepID=A0ACC3NH98_9PEZI|nr:hypothetical protein LTR37_006055 [Vermiconidia calcicola]
MKRKREAAAAKVTRSPEISEDDPIAKRLRAAKRNNYAEPDEEDIFATPAEPPAKKRRPSPIVMIAQSDADALDKTPSPKAFARDDSPARNTRSQSKASIEPLVGYENFDFDNFAGAGDNVDWDAFMDSELDAIVPDDEDTVAVAAPKAASRRNSKNSPTRKSARSSPTSSSPNSNSGTFALRRSRRNTRASSRAQ